MASKPEIKQDMTDIFEQLQKAAMKFRHSRTYRAVVPQREANLMLRKLVHEGIQQSCGGMYSKSELRLSVDAMVRLHASGTQFFKEFKDPVENFWESATVYPLCRASDFFRKER